MDLVAGPLGSVVIKLGKLLKEEYELQTGLRKKITRLSADLESMHAALRKAAEVPPDQLDDEVKLWARDVRELSYDVDDILDTFLVQVEDSKARSDPNWLKRTAKKIGKLFSKSMARHQIDGMIKIINEQAEVVAERHRRYRAEDIIVSKPAAPRTVDPRLEAMYKQVTQLVGIEKPSDDLISRLSSHSGDQGMKMKMVSVVGPGGLGKTTLAKAVYDKLKMDFQCTAFVPVGRDPDLKKVFRDILIDLDKEKYLDPKFIGLDERQHIDEIREYLENKRYFIVIDDVWNTDTWKIIEWALVQNNNGSRVIATTRHSDVADLVGEVYKLEPLPRDQSEKLFYTRIFGAHGTCPNNELEEVSDKILNKCNGVPLAIITMSSLLVGKTAGEWIEVCNSVIFRDIKKNHQVSDTEWILSLSYYDLPPHLRTCLLYLSAFPEDVVIYKDSLIWKWVAEGFVHNKEPGTVSLFEVGEGYFDELINRSMIQAVKSERNGLVYGCQIHDMVLDLLRVKSQQENFITILSGVNESTLSSPGRVRRVAHQNRTVEHTYQDTQADLRHVRTFFIVACRGHKLSFQSFQLLRVLALEGCSGSITGLEHIENLLHLRYLGIVETNVSELPEGIGALKFLQTLELVGTDIRELPSTVGLLTQLICLIAFGPCIPNGTVVEKLTSLEELHIMSFEGQIVKELGNLLELRVLHAEVQITGSSFQSDLVKSLGKLKKLQHLELRNQCNNLLPNNDNDADEAIWDTAVLPRPLRHIIIVADVIDFKVLPQCINPSDLPNLTRLELSVRQMDEQSLRILGGLPELRHLWLLTWSSPTTITVHHATEGVCFQKLICLSVLRSTVLFVVNEEDSSVSFTIWCPYKGDVPFGSEKRDVRAPAAIMPNLRLLEFKVSVRALMNSNSSCDRLGLEYLPSLQKVQVGFLCNDAFADDLDKQEAALRHAIEAHPNRPTLEIERYGSPSQPAHAGN